MGEERREQLLLRLKEAEQPVTASAFAHAFAVSRQVIVGDVALLRAAGCHIRATAQGYVLVNQAPASGYRGRVACQHSAADTAAELELIIALGGEVLDVSVAHPLYGELKGNLDLKTPADVANFMTLLGKEEALLLSALTGGVHLHTIVAPSEADFIAIKAALQTAGYLYEN